ncbi:MAG: Type 1 glutamine amidotransferase-like domain-containing protein [Bacilli bacterium]|nr:Type 1 glutamine amidotransferase-like domain-containing protein [Bacilli bacterium]
MYSVFFSKIDEGFECVKERLNEIIKEDFKVAIIPWAFPVEINSEIFNNDYFKKGERRYNKYVMPLMDLGIKEENIFVCNCYSSSKEELINIINKSDVLLIPGGNPEMLFKKVLHDTEIFYHIKNFKGVVIGESAGTELQLKRYFITAKNNYYKYFAFYDGFGLIDDPFYMDVHSIEDPLYLSKLKEVSNETKKDVYAIFDDGVILYNRDSKEIEFYGNVQCFKYE